MPVVGSVSRVDLLVCKSSIPGDGILAGAVKVEWDELRQEVEHELRVFRTRPVTITIVLTIDVTDSPGQPRVNERPTVLIFGELHRVFERGFANRQTVHVETL